MMELDKVKLDDIEQEFQKFKDEKKRKIAKFKALQNLPYAVKVRRAERRAIEFQEEMYARDRNCHVSVGGLDSITLLLFLRKVGIKAPAISVSSLEDKSIQEVHKQLDIEVVKPYKNKAQIINEYGFPVISKKIANKIDTLQNPTEENKTVRNAIITGDCGEQGHFRKNSRMKLPQKWLQLFGGLENENYGTNYQTAPFKVSHRCCYYLKEKPCDDWAREHNSYPYLGMLASEGGQRQDALMMNGCNYYGKTVTRSAPFAIFMREDILQLALDLNVPLPAIYGTIEKNASGKLCTTKAQRTGCSMCGFGIHMEKRPHRFDLLRERNDKEWRFWMYKCYKDKATGEQYGWGRVLDYIGVSWEDVYTDWDSLQVNLWDWGRSNGATGDD